jgi:hypothetical protein
VLDRERERERGREGVEWAKREERRKFVYVDKRSACIHSER